MKRLVLIAALFAAPLAAQLQPAEDLYYGSRYEEAKSLLKPLRNDPEALHLLSKIAMAQSDDETAAELCRKAAQLRLGMIFEKQGKKAEARQTYATALKLDPGSKEIQEAMKRVR